MTKVRHGGETYDLRVDEDGPYLEPARPALRAVPSSAVIGWCRVCKDWTWIADFRCGEHDPTTRIPYSQQRRNR